MSALRLIRTPTSHGWSVRLPEGRQLVSFAGPFLALARMRTSYGSPTVREQSLVLPFGQVLGGGTRRRSDGCLR